MPNRHSTLTSLFDDIADAIRAKTGSAASIVADDFDTAIAAIPTGGGSSDNYLYIQEEAGTGGIITFAIYGNNLIGYPTVQLQWSTDKTTWTNIVLSDSVTIATVNIAANQKIYIKNNVDSLSLGVQSYLNIYSTVDYSIGGSINSLLNDTNGDYIYPYCYYSLFSGSHLVDVSNLQLPKTTADYCYSNIFANSIIQGGPVLPAKHLASNCYSYMFSGCSNLLTAPTLISTNIASYCYSSMFENCTSLQAAPALPATVLENYCYANMFKGCISLTTAPALPATTLASGCYSNMFINCASLTTPPALPATTGFSNCYNYMFANCTSLVKVPALPFNTLVSNCYSYMFSGCTSLKVYSTSDTGHSQAWNIPTSGTLTGTTRAQNNMFNGVITDSVPANFPGTTGTQFTYYTEYAPIE